MAITNIKVSNFKSFKDLDLALGPFNVVIGANAAGKSNFTEVFRFLRTVEENSIEDALLLHGGARAIRNVSLDSSRPLRIRATSDREMAWGSGGPLVRVADTMYEFSLQWDDSSDNVIISDDHLVQKLRLSGTAERASAPPRENEITLGIWLSDDRREVSLQPPDVIASLKGDPGFSVIELYTSTLGLKVESWEARSLLIRTRFFDLLPPEESLFGGVGLYDIDPHAAKKPHAPAGKARLEENGENLALVVTRILADAEKRRKLHNLVRYLLPFVAEVGTERYLGESVLLKLREEYYEGDLLANLLSDGTVDVVALIIALFFEDKDVVIIEEPERNIHPHLISGLVTLMKDAARNKQVIITTHSPEVVRHARVENLLLISRDEEGFSTVSRPAEKQDVKAFLENDLGLDEVFVQELWGR